MIRTTPAPINRRMQTLLAGLLLVLGSVGSSRVVGQEMHSVDFFSGLDRIQTTCNDLSKGEIASIKKLVDDGVSLDTQGKHGMTLLLWTWCSSNPLAFEALLELGADPHVRLTSDVQIEVALNPLLLENGSSVVENVVRYNRVQQNFLEKVVRFLREANDHDRMGRSLIHLLMLDADDRLIVRKPLPAVQHGRYAKEVTEFLEKSRRQLDGMKRVQLSSFALLFGAGTKVTTKDNAGKTPLISYIDWLQTLEQQDPGQNFASRADLTLGSSLRLFSETDYLEDQDRLNSLIVALEAFRERIKLPPTSSLRSTIDLLKRGQRDIKDIRLHRESFLENKEIALYPSEEMFAETLCETVNDSILRYKDPKDLFSPEDLKKLMISGLDLNHQGKNGFTFLLSSYLVRKSEWFESLLKLGANPASRLTGDLAPYLKPRFLQARGLAFCPEKGESVLMAIALNPSERETYMRIAMKYCKEWNDRDDFQRNLLHRMMYHRVPESQDLLVRDLVDLGVDLNAQTIGGSTPCHLAVYRNASYIPKLVAKGADPNIRDVHGRTVLDLLQLSIDQKWTFHDESVLALQKIKPQDR